MCTICHKYMHICEMLILICTEHTSTMSPELMKLRIMIISNKTKILVKFGTSEVTCVEHTSTMSPELMKLRIMTISIKTMVLIKFGTFKMMCVELRAKKL